MGEGDFQIPVGTKWCYETTTMPGLLVMCAEEAVVGVALLLDELIKWGMPRVYLNKMGYPHFRGGARQRTPAKRLQFALWRLHPTHMVRGQYVKPFFRPSAPQNRVNAGASKLLSKDRPILFVNYRGHTPFFC